jgi:hypothetical protein
VPSLVLNKEQCSLSSTVEMGRACVPKINENVAIYKLRTLQTHNVCIYFDESTNASKTILNEGQSFVLNEEQCNPGSSREMGRACLLRICQNVAIYKLRTLQAHNVCVYFDELTKACKRVLNEVQSFVLTEQ